MLGDFEKCVLTYDCCAKAMTAAAIGVTVRSDACGVEDIAARSIALAEMILHLVDFQKMVEMLTTK